MVQAASRVQYSTELTVCNRLGNDKIRLPKIEAKSEREAQVAHQDSVQLSNIVGLGFWSLSPFSYISLIQCGRKNLLQ